MWSLRTSEAAVVRPRPHDGVRHQMLFWYGGDQQLHKVVLLAFTAAGILALYAVPPQGALAQVRDSAVVVAPFTSVGALGAEPEFGRTVIAIFKERLPREGTRYLLPWDSLVAALPASLQTQVRPMHLQGCLGVRQISAYLSRDFVIICGSLEELTNGAHQMTGMIGTPYSSEPFGLRIIQDPEEGADYLLQLVQTAERAAP